MIDVIIFIVSAGPNVLKENLIETVYSISKNIGEVNYKYYIVTDSRDQEKFINEVMFVHPRLQQAIPSDALLEVVYRTGSWAAAYNEFFKKYGNSTKYILISHDDLTINTPDFFNKTLKQTEGKEEEIGWITYTNDYYYKFAKKPIANSCKDPFSIDRGKDPQVYECHQFDSDEKITPENRKKLKFPKAPVKCHGPYTHFNLISTRALHKMPPCVDWTPYTILLDNDWNLEALKANLFNVWVPDVVYTHPNPKYKHLRKPGTDLRFERTAHQKFYEKWGFWLPMGDRIINDEAIEFIREKYKDTHIPLSSYKNTYDWDYLK